MNTLTKLTFGTVAVAALSLVPYIYEHSQAGRLERELALLQQPGAASGAENARLRNEITRLRMNGDAARQMDTLREENQVLRNQTAALAQQIAQQGGRRFGGFLPRPTNTDGTPDSYGEADLDMSGLVDLVVAPDIMVAGKGPSWSPQQATGAPDTKEAGDVQTAWASREPDGGVEWLQLKYDKPVDVATINIHETYNPGAVSKITALMPDGHEQTLWEGTEPAEEAPIEMSYPMPPGVRSDQIKVYVDTARVPGWNEIDAVELVGTDGSKQWAKESSASSYFGDNRALRGMPINYW